MSAQHTEVFVCRLVRDSFWLLFWSGVVGSFRINICHWLQPLKSSSSQLLQVCWFSDQSYFLAQSLPFQVM